MKNDSRTRQGQRDTKEKEFENVAATIFLVECGTGPQVYFESAGVYYENFRSENQTIGMALSTKIFGDQNCAPRSWIPIDVLEDKSSRKQNGFLGAGGLKSKSF